MLVTLGILGVSLGAVGFAAWWVLRQRGLSSARSTAVVGVLMWITASAVVAWRLEEPRQGSQLDLVRSVGSLAWPNAPAAESVPSSSRAAVQAASVESLVGGLEARLSAQPNDAEGWALLAQSYAFTSNEEAVERAVQRAVSLGFDEQALRERVAVAQRRAPEFDWVDRALSAQQP